MTGLDGAIIIGAIICIIEIMIPIAILIGAKIYNHRLNHAE